MIKNHEFLTNHIKLHERNPSNWVFCTRNLLPLIYQIKFSFSLAFSSTKEGVENVKTSYSDMEHFSCMLNNNFKLKYRPFSLKYYRLGL